MGGGGSRVGVWSTGTQLLRRAGQGQRLSLEGYSGAPAGQATALQDEKLLVGRVSQQNGFANAA
jgi:hypothetical protein